jgi:DNA-binding response OmpR family regulator
MSDILKARDVELDPIKHLVTCAGKPVHLLPRDFTLLEFLMRHPGEVFSVEALLSRVWNYDDDASAEGLRTAIRRLRMTLDHDKNPNQSLIENVVKIGYRLRA